jgi:hypothetical protein
MYWIKEYLGKNIGSIEIKIKKEIIKAYYNSDEPKQYEYEIIPKLNGIIWEDYTEKFLKNRTITYAQLIELIIKTEQSIILELNRSSNDDLNYNKIDEKYLVRDYIINAEIRVHEKLKNLGFN